MSIKVLVIDDSALIRSLLSEIINRQDFVTKPKIDIRNGERVLPGYAYLAQGNRHLLLRRSGANIITLQNFLMDLQ